jgi:putative integral membrane protein (TIGR02587 family)
MCFNHTWYSAFLSGNIGANAPALISNEGPGFVAQQTTLSSMHTSRPALRESLQEYGRGIAGGLMFSMPLLYTMEMWWSGFTLPPERLLVGVFVTLGLLLGYNRFSGLRADASWLEIAIDSVEEFGLAVLLAVGALAALGRIGPDTPFEELAGKVIVEALVVAIGVSVGTAQLGDERARNKEGMTGDQQGDAPATFGEQVVIALCGAVLFAANVAPTDEILMLGVELPPASLLLLVVVSLVLGLLILQYSGFARSSRVRGETTIDVFGGVVVTYAVALLASAMLLWFFGRFDGMSPLASLGQLVVLAGPAMLGASAGRLLLQ